MTEGEVLKLAAIVVPVVYVFGVANAAHAIMHARTPQSSVAWAIALISFPWLTIPIYWFFGSSGFQKYADRLRKAEEEHQDLANQLRADMERFGGKLPEDESATQTFLERLTGWRITRGNHFDLLVDGQATFDAIFAAIEAAERYVAVEFFIVKNDGLGRRLKDLLIRKAREGVKVYFLTDAIGSHALGRAYARELTDAGVAFRLFRPETWILDRFHINFRNHRKIVVVDGKCAFVGGHNVGDEYLGKNPRLGPWRDTHVRFEGPAVQGAQLTFLIDWYWMTKALPAFDWTPAESPDGHALCLALESGPHQQLESCRHFIVHAIDTARQRIWIASPYFVPDEGFVQALQMAALRGVDVRIMLPEKPDHRIVYLASFSYLRDLIPHGVKIYRYKAGFLHEKVLLVDDRWASVGTANIDNRSFRMQFEISMLVFDREFAREVAAMFEADFAHCEEQPADACERRGLLFGIVVRSCRLLAPLL